MKSMTSRAITPFVLFFWKKIEIWLNFLLLLFSQPLTIAVSTTLCFIYSHSSVDPLHGVKYIALRQIENSAYLILYVWRNYCKGNTAPCPWVFPVYFFTHLINFFHHLLHSGHCTSNLLSRPRGFLSLNSVTPIP